jgi:alcohol dehydrogenase class IV
MRFEFATSARIIFGPGTLGEAAPAARSFGRRALLVLGKSSTRAGTLLEKLQAEGVTASLFHVDGEPGVETVIAGVEQARDQRCELVIGLGGGSALDAGKAIAALLTNPGEIYDYLEVVGLGQALGNAPAAYIAIPTTSGTGSEATRNAVLTACPSHSPHSGRSAVQNGGQGGVKVSLRSASMLPRLAIVDPTLTHGLPPEVTAASGMDALTQLIEPFVSNTPNPLVDGFCREGIQRAARALRPACEADDPDAREDMALASLLSGMALANAKLGAVHAFAGPLGGMFAAPHGALCARLLPLALAANLKALRERAPQSPSLARFDELAHMLTGDPGADAEDGIAWLQGLCAAFKIAPLAAYGIKKSDFPAIAAQAQKANSMKGNPLALTDDELVNILEAAL